MSDKEHLDTDIEEMEEDTQEGKYLTFSLGKREFGIEIRNVTEIIGIQNITDLPDVPHYVKGVMNLRGKVIPVIDVRLRFGLEERDYDDRTCIIVVNINHMAVGLIVDSVSEVLDISAKDIEPPARWNQSNGDYIQGFGKVGEEVKILLDSQKLLFIEDLETLTEQVS